MKKFLTLFFVIGMIVCGSLKSEAMKYEEAILQSKPAAVLVYASWADGAQATLQAFKAMEQRYANKFNFVVMDIATKDAKEFNKVYQIFPNVPYVIMFKNGGKITRYFKQECVNDASCFAQKLDFFAN